MLLNFKFTLQNSFGIREAIYNPGNSSLCWEDSGEELFSSSFKNQEEKIIEKTSPTNPVGKSHALRRIKIQMGFACNYTCTYCSQNNQRPEQKASIEETFSKVPIFLKKMESWFDGGEDKKGSGVFLEFWGGETLLYWEAVREMAKALRTRYPKIHLALFTNGSILTKEMADTALELSLHFYISHDGPTFSQDRARDPFDIPSQALNLKYLFHRLNPQGLVSFNATISPKNFSLPKIRKYIADKLEVEPGLVKLTHDLATPYDSAGLLYIANEGNRTNLVNKIFKELLGQYPFDLNVGGVDRVVHDFFESLSQKRSQDAVGQKCSMDLPTSLAVDIDGNVLTCQNVTAKGGHKIGHVDELHNAKLNTAYHWSARSECTQCPVVQICKGSCMFLTKDLWSASCDQHFTWSLAYLALALYLQTNYFLIKIEGPSIRRSGVSFVDVLDKDFLN